MAHQQQEWAQADALWSISVEGSDSVKWNFETFIDQMLLSNSHNIFAFDSINSPKKHLEVAPFQLYILLSHERFYVFSVDVSFSCCIDAMEKRGWSESLLFR